VPFGELAWDHVRAGMPKATEEELADAVAALLARAHAGPDTGQPGGPASASKRDRRVVARTRATSTTPPLEPPPEPRAEKSTGLADPDSETELGEDDEPLAKVIPLGIFDPFAEAAKRW
jgi:hypothetical protein